MIGIYLNLGNNNTINIISCPGTLYTITDKTSASNNTVRRMEPISGTTSSRDMTIKPLIAPSLDDSYTLDSVLKIASSKALYDMYTYLVNLITNNRNPYMLYYVANFKSAVAVSTSNSLYSVLPDSAVYDYYKDPVNGIQYADINLLVKDVFDSTSVVTPSPSHPFMSDVGILYFEMKDLSPSGGVCSNNTLSPFFPWAKKAIKIKGTEGSILFKIHYTVTFSINPQHADPRTERDFLFAYPAIHRAVVDDSGTYLNHHNKLIDEFSEAVYDDPEISRNQSCIYQDFATDLYCRDTYNDDKLTLTYYGSYLINHTHLDGHPQEYLIMGFVPGIYYDADNPVPESITQPKVEILFEFIKQNPQ